MRTDQLIHAAERLLEEERATFAAATDTGESARIASRLESARRALEEAVSAARAERADGDGPFRRVMVAVDQSRQADWAMEMAIRLARTTGAEVAALHVVTDPGAVSPELAYAEPALRAQRLDVGNAVLRDAIARATAGQSVKPLLREGPPAGVIVDTAKDWNADLIVIGTHGRGLLGRLLIGGTAEAVVRHAHCPVLTISHAPVPEVHVPAEPAQAAHPLQQQSM